ncbi:DegT/DnrJ/EryC1/StrS family aminotransferase [Paenibacillus flagellatus]|uniref:DegT/DnrJ/EryC1/StrS family aminotransferase n=1 Tax=Paenibacillus flagellatus TaxID=2211139 RepID=A0A2V5K8G5_9BACL|nr:DegT/DnrJ/EryC1/StrS family aminotransferase [Paenibacillus flagellatus]PYI55799.1 DegT/DnrJ/EryC1/StrS family aminotransferase [Paenibacillus flagellatus]
MGQLAINGGTPVRTEPFASWPIYDDTELRLLKEVLESGKWGGSGSSAVPNYEAKLPLMERKFAELHGARHAVSVVNGTVAISVALQAAGLKPGDEVIVPPYTFIATASAALACGMIPVFADIEEETLLIDPEKIEPLLTAKTRAIVAVHIAGAPANMTRLREIAAKHDLVLIEDAAQAVGASWEGQGVGSIGDLGTFSLQSSKNLNAGEGGVITTNSAEYWENAWSICNVGRVPNGGWYQHDRFGQNYRMTEFQAAIVLAQMTRLEEQMRRRERNAKLLDGLLAGIDGIRLLRQDPRITRHAYHLYMFKLDPAFAERADKAEFVKRVNAEGIPLAAGYIPLNKNVSVLETTKMWTGEERVYDCPVCERMCAKEAVWLTQNVLLSDERAIRDVAEALDKVVRSF